MKEKNTVVKILTDSFKENKSVNYVVKPGGKQNIRRGHLMDYSYEVCKRWGKVWLSENNQACALTINSNDKRSSIGLDLKLAINAIGLLRATKVLSREGKIKKNYPKEPFLYLWFIGVEPSNQGKGEGTKLLHTILEDADKKGLPVLLETSTKPNIPWYEKNGFKTYATIDFGYDLLMMRRDPR